MSYQTVPLLRGFTEISVAWDLIQDLGNIVICGGYARYCASPRYKPVPSGDVDLFPQTNEVSAVLLEQLTELGFEVKHENDMAITLKTEPDLEDWADPRWTYTPRLQIIKPVVEGRVVSVGDVETILDNFDFSVVRAAIISPTEVLVDEHFLGDEQNLNLRLLNIHCPISSTLRVIKYTGKGYHIRPFEITKLFLDWENRTSDYRARLVDLMISSEEGQLTDKEIQELEALMRND